MKLNFLQGGWLTIRFPARPYLYTMDFVVPDSRGLATSTLPKRNGFM